MQPADATGPCVCFRREEQQEMRQRGLGGETGCKGTAILSPSMYLYLLGLLLAQIQGDLELRLLVNLHCRRGLGSSSKDYGTVKKKKRKQNI